MYIQDRIFNTTFQEFDMIENEFRELKLVLPIGNNNDLFNYDTEKVFSGSLAFIILEAKLSDYNNLHQYTQKAIEFFIYDFGYTIVKYDTFLNKFLKQQLNINPNERIALCNKILYVWRGHLCTEVVKLIDCDFDKKIPNKGNQTLIESYKNILKNIELIENKAPLKSSSDNH